MRLKPATVPFGRPQRPTQSPARNGISPFLFYGLFAVLCGTNVLGVIAFLMSPDIAKLLGGQTEVVLSAYEDRIAQLRIEVDRLHSRNYAQTGDINIQLQELAQQQEVLTEQQQFVRLLAQKADELGIKTGSDGLALGDDEAALTNIAPLPATPSDKIARVAAEMDEMMAESRQALAAISDVASESTDEIIAALNSLGIRPDLPTAAAAMGGPFLPAQDGPDSFSLIDDANDVMEALGRFKAAKDAVNSAPVNWPLAGKFKMSSSYGNRRDPFTGGKAFHAGLDFPAPKGTLVLAPGDGVVTFVGTQTGYGNVVEITHRTGLITRYAHLSAFIAKEGQSVNVGTPIAKVGSTGRSTGPHLHLEVRREDKPLDPRKFLAVGKRLKEFAV